MRPPDDSLLAVECAPGTAIVGGGAANVPSGKRPRGHEGMGGDGIDDYESPFIADTGGTAHLQCMRAYDELLQALLSGSINVSQFNDTHVNGTEFNTCYSSSDTSAPPRAFGDQFLGRQLELPAFTCNPTRAATATAPPPGERDEVATRALLHAIARRHGVRVRGVDADGPFRFSCAALVDGLLLATQRCLLGTAVELTCHAPTGCAHTHCAARARAGAISILAARFRCALAGPSPHPRVLCGDWPLRDLCRRRSVEQARELASFVWPITGAAELARLRSMRHARPLHLVGCESSAAIRCALERSGQVALSVDLRASRVPGIHAQMDVRLAISAGPWISAYLFPAHAPQTVADGAGRADADLDGRAFWSVAFFIFCWCADACRLLVEHSDSRIPDFYLAPSQRLSPAHFGDNGHRLISLFTRGRAPIAAPCRAPGAPDHDTTARARRPPEGKERHSPWSRFPRTTRAMIAAPAAGPDEAPCYAQEIQKLAAAWFDHGLPVPEGYDACDARPPTAEARQYQRRRGGGDGRRLDGVTPALRRASPDDRDRERLSPADQARLLGEFSALAANGAILCLVAMMATPLVFAALDGVRVIGANFDSAHSRASAVRVAGRWAASAASSLAAGTFLVGEYAGGPRLMAAPVHFTPPAEDIVRRPRDRQIAWRAGRLMAWCTLAALANTPIADPAARALAAVSELRNPVAHLADVALSAAGAPTRFRFGAFAATSIVNAPLNLAPAHTQVGLSMARDASWSRMLFDALLATGAPDMLGWAERIRPPPLADVPDGLLEVQPDYDNARFDALAFSPLPAIPSAPPLLRLPSQPPPPRGFCPRSAAALLLPAAQRRVRQWLNATLSDLLCVRREGADCERRRPRPLAVGQTELVPQARGIIWDFRARGCGVPLDFAAPIAHTLNVTYLANRLATFPNQRLVSMLRDGVRFMADVELQSVFVPHLTSLAQGYGSVHKELGRLSALGWYQLLDDLPFWPIYLNGQGAATRKLEDRWRRTTEGGGPRTETRDASGLRAWSINDAYRTYHTPAHYLRDTRPEMLRWLESRGLPRPPEEQAAPRAGGKLGPEVKPTPAMVMRDLCVLGRAAKLLGEPLYLFGEAQSS